MKTWKREEVDILLSNSKQTTSQISILLSKKGYLRTNDAIKSFKKRYLKKNKKGGSPVIGVVDIETLPLKVYTWGIYKQNISDKMIIEDWCMLSWAGKILDEIQVEGDVLSSEEAIKRKDKRILGSLWEFLNKCDVIIAHNAVNFDVKKINSRFFLNNISPTSPFKVIDTLKQSRSSFGLTCNKLDYIGKLVLRKQKLSTDFNLWKKCDQGDEESLQYMFTYNKEDVYLLQSIYLKMRPWTKNTPNLGVINPQISFSCSECGSSNLKENGFHITSTSKFRCYSCKDCGSFSRERKSILGKEEKENLLVPIK